MMDISATNAFLITTNGTEDRSHRAHRTFQEELTTQLLPVANKEELTTQLLSVANGAGCLRVHNWRANRRGAQFGLTRL
jgi:hypothetical protein